MHLNNEILSWPGPNSNLLRIKMKLNNKIVYESAHGMMTR